MLPIFNSFAFILQKLSTYLVFKMFIKLCQYPYFYFYIGLNYSISTHCFSKLHVITIVIIIDFTYVLSFCTEFSNIYKQNRVPKI